MPTFDSESKEPVASVSRRGFLAAGAVLVAAVALESLRRRAHAAALVAPAPAENVLIVAFSDSGQRLGVSRVPKIVKTDAEWRKQLSPLAYGVTRHADTEYAFSGDYWNNHEAGLYRCICCGTALFSSTTKFDSGTGWPSFTEPIAMENIESAKDTSLGMDRDAVACRRCDAHQGHVFDDGPPPTGLRYCINSVSLRFVKFA